MLPFRGWLNFHFKMSTQLNITRPSRALDVMTEVDGMMRYGSRLAWFVGSLSSVDTASCCGDMRVSVILSSCHGYIMSLSASFNKSIL